MNNCDSHCWTIVPVTVEQSCQWLLSSRASDCLIIVPATVEESCQWLLNNRAGDCWRIMRATVEQSVSDCWRIVPVTVKQSCQTFLKLVKEYYLRNNTFHDCNWTRNHSHFVRKRTLNHLAKTLLRLDIAAWEILVR